MAERDGYIPGVPCWVDTTQPDPRAVLLFYSGLFGWELKDVMPEGSESPYFIAYVRGGDVAAVAQGTTGAPAVWNTYIWVDSADVAAETARAAGGKVIVPPFDVGGAGRMAALADPEGATFSVWQAKAHKGAKVVNEHGALIFNNLATGDLEAARAFYGAMFGWRTLELPWGKMWALPGYGDHLEARTPGLRDQMAQMGAPEGFIDVVAGLDEVALDDPAAMARWTVTFATDDAEATAAKARELGGSVVSGPVDAPWTRVVTIRDPGGAVFVASQFVPENSGLSG